MSDRFDRIAEEMIRLGSDGMITFCGYTEAGAFETVQVPNRVMLDKDAQMFRAIVAEAIRRAMPEVSKPESRVFFVELRVPGKLHMRSNAFDSLKAADRHADLLSENDRYRISHAFIEVMDGNGKRTSLRGFIGGKWEPCGA